MARSALKYQGVIQFRRGTTEELAATPFIPAEGELILDLTEKKFKIGDGVTFYSALDWASFPEVQEAITAANTATQQANRAEDAANLAQQYSNAIPYDTVEGPNGLKADLSQPDKTKGWVFLDTEENNGIWVFDAAEQDWFKATEDAQPASKKDINQVVESIVGEYISAAEVNNYALVLADMIGKIAMTLSKSGMMDVKILRSAAGKFLTGLDGTIKVTGLTFSETNIPGVALAIIDKNDRVALQINTDGTIPGLSGSGPTMQQFNQLEARVTTLEEGGTSGEATGPIAIDEGKVYEIGLNGDDQLLFDPTPYVIDETVPIRPQGKSLIGVWNRPIFGTRTPFASCPPVQGSILTGMTIPYSRKLMAIILGIGQSNEVGAQSSVMSQYQAGFENMAYMLSGTGAGVRIVPDNTGASPGNEPVFNPDNITGLSLLASTSIGNRGTTMMEGMAGVLHPAFRERFGFDVPIIYLNCGYGGRLQSAMAKGTRIYSNAISAATKAAEIAIQLGYQPWFPYIDVGHGESDSSHPEYIENIIQWQIDYQNDLQAISNQLSDIPFVCSQASTFVRSSSSTPVQNWQTPGVLAPFYASRSHPGKFIMAGPYYSQPMNNSDFLHLRDVGHAKMGEYKGLAALNGVFGTSKFGGLEPIDIEYNGTSEVIINFHVPYGPLVIDPDNPLIPPPEDGNWGFQIFDGLTGLPVVIAQKDLGPTYVRLITTQPIAAGSQRGVGYGLYGYTSPKTLGTQPRGILRDQCPTKSRVDGQPLYHWCDHFFLSF